VCAWVDVSDTLHPESAAAMGVDLSRLLWIRCGSSPVPSPSAAVCRLKVKPGLPPGGGGHPRMEANGLSAAVSDLLGPAQIAPRCAEALHKPRPQGKQQNPGPPPTKLPPAAIKTASRGKSWARLEQALRVTDLLLQAGGFSCIVLDMGSLNAEYALRVPLATWFRFRTAAERLQSNVLLLTQHACSRNSAGLVLRLEPGSVLAPDSTIFTGLEHRAELGRQRFPQPPGNVFPLRKQPQSVPTAQWQGRALWAGRS
jgi:recombination protein RecA